jgi:hypothetical protein
MKKASQTANFFLRNDRHTRTVYTWRNEVNVEQFTWDLKCRGNNDIFLI